MTTASIIVIVLLVVGTILTILFMKKSKSESPLATVVCLKPTSTLTKGREYSIISVSDNGSKVSVRNDYGKTITVFKDRFDV